MIENQNKVDDTDRVYLIGAMCLANEREDAIPEGEIARVGVVEVGQFFATAQSALEHVATFHREPPEEWDGVVWYELICSAEEGSLADRLVALIQHLDRAPTPPEVREEVMLWLTSYGL